VDQLVTEDVPQVGPCPLQGAGRAVDAQRLGPGPLEVGVRIVAQDVRRVFLEREAEPLAARVRHEGLLDEEHVVHQGPHVPALAGGRRIEPGGGAADLGQRPGAAACIQVQQV
jgi:hypothetical protein